MKKLVTFLFVCAVLFSMIPAAPALAQDGEAPTVTLYISEDFSYSVALPEGWAASDNPEGGIRFANSEATLASMEADGDPVSGEIGINLIALPLETASEFGLAEDATLVDWVTVLQGIAQQQNADENLVFGEAFEFELFERTWGGVDGQGTAGDRTIVAFEIAPGYLGLAFMGFAAGEGAQLGIDAFNVLGTARYSFPLEATFTSVNGITFNYPEEWITQDQGQIVYVANVEEALTIEVLEPGQHGLLIGTIAPENVTLTDLGQIATNLTGTFAPPDSGAEVAEPVVFSIGEEEEAREIAIVGVTGLPGGDANTYVTLLPNGGIAFVINLSGVGTTFQMGLVSLNILLSMQTQ